MADQVSRQASITPITAEIIRHQLLSISRQIDVNITRTAYSPLVYEYKDYAVGIVDPEGRLIAQSDGGIPLFFANALGVAVRDGLAVHGASGIEDGDILFSNHAATLGQHLNNVVMYTPVYVEGRLVAFMAVLVHWIDVGGIALGSCILHTTTEIYQEGVQFRSVRLYRRGELVSDILRTIEVNSRLPQMLLGDINSQIAGCMRGKEMIKELFDKHGIDTMRAAITANWDSSERAARAAVGRIKEGAYEAESFLDDDGLTRGERVPIHIKVRVAGGEIEVDFSGVADQLKGPYNSGRAGGAETAARIAFKYLFSPSEPPNEGTFRPLRVTIPEGKFLSAKPGAPLGCYSFPLPTVVDTIVKAFVEAAPDLVAAGHYATLGGHTIYGRHPKSGELYQNLGTIAGGWGAMAGRDGGGPFRTMTHGDTLDVPIEVLEALYPFRVDVLRLRQDSGGAGTFRGGLGVEKLYTMRATGTARAGIDRTGCPPWGIMGGKDGAPSEARIERKDRAPEVILKGVTELDAGDAARTLTGGGGGYGDPLKRDPERVLADVREGYVSRERAARDYGVAIDDQGRILAEETRRLRSVPAQAARER